MLTRRITTPLRRLTEASRDLAEGDFARRVPSDAIEDGPIELSELGLQFNAMAERLQESVEIIRRDRDRSREFLADVSHELRTPIAALRTFNELLDRGRRRRPGGAGRVPRDEPRPARAPRLARPEPARALEARLRARAARPSAGGPPLRPSSRRSSRRRPTARRRGVELTMDAPGRRRSRSATTRSGSARSSPTWSATRSSSRRAAARSASRSAAEPDGGASITVADTGIGIDPAELPRIFDRFFRGSRASEARGSGSGLGLAIVRSIVEMHGGTVAVESRLGAGATFRVDAAGATRGHRPTPDARRVAETSPSPRAEPEPGTGTLGSDMTDEPTRARRTATTRRRPTRPTTRDGRLLARRRSAGRSGPVRRGSIRRRRPSSDPSRSPRPGRRRAPVPVDAGAAERRAGRASARSRRGRSCRRCSRRAGRSSSSRATGALDRPRRRGASTAGRRRSRRPVADRRLLGGRQRRGERQPGGRPDHRDGRQRPTASAARSRRRGVGSGVIYDAAGWILTNRHVVGPQRRHDRRRS